MLQLYPAYLLCNRHKTLTGSPDPTRANGTNKPCIITSHGLNLISHKPDLTAIIVFTSDLTKHQKTQKFQKYQLSEFLSFPRFFMFNLTLCGLNLILCKIIFWVLLVLEFPKFLAKKTDFKPVWQPYELPKDQVL